MKFLEIPELGILCSLLSGIQGEIKLETILECYSCKKSSSDKELYNSLEQDLQNSLPSPTNSSGGSSPFGSFSKRKNRNIFIYLIATLSSVYPDFNFSKVKESSFKKVENYSTVVNHVDTEFMGSVKDYSEIRNKFWTELNKVIEIPHTSIFSYIPGEYSDDDPLAQSSLWGFNYFFYNEKDKKVLFLQSRASVASDSSEEEMRDSDESEDGMSGQQFHLDL